jgi:protein-disulfide isomerase
MRWPFTLALALVAGFGGAALWDLSGLGGKATRDYLMANPEVLPAAIEVLQQRDTLARLEPLRRDLETPWPGAVMGNPQGTVTLVEFSDYACGYCRQSLEDVNQLIAANPDLKVVIREYPILSPGSMDAARMALAAAQQGKYAAFHDAMFERGPPTDATIEAAAQAVGVDLTMARTAIVAGVFEPHLQANASFAAALGISGTPGWIVGDQLLNGAVGRAALGEAIETATKS